MKKVFTKVVVLILALSMSMAIFAGCGNSRGKTGENVLNIGYYLGGYDTKWAIRMAADFEAANPGTEVILDADRTIVGKIPRYLEDGSVYDIFFSHGIEWEVAAKSGWLEPLDDLYATEVTAGVTVKDRVLDNFIDNSKFKGKGDTEEKFYKMHWTNGVGGIVYNKLLFEKNGWKVPTTYAELVALCETIYSANLSAPNNPDERVRPFVFSNEDYYWDYLVFDWMVQLCGKEALDEMLQLKSPEVFNPETSEVVKAQSKALKLWADLIAKNSKYSMVNSIGKEYRVAQSDFLNGAAAMMPNAQWLENEMIDSIDDAKCVMAMMPSPTVDGAKTENGKVIRYSKAVGGDDSIIIPEKAPNKALAKKFLVFMSQEENAINFTKHTRGVMTGLKYDEAKLAAIPNATPFMESVFEINNNSIKYDNYSSSILRLNAKIKCEWFTTTGFAPYQDLMKTPSTDIDRIFSNYYNHVKNNWSGWGGK